MKLNKLTSALVGLGIVSLAGVAHAQTVVYLTGSTAARSFVFNALTTPGQVFPAGGTVVSPSPNNSGSATYVVVAGTLTNGTAIDIDCSWTGSEAGIAAVAGQPLNQAVNGGTYSLPGVPPSFLTQASTWTVLTNLAHIAGAPANPDLSMADTSQAVSQTPKSLYNLTDYGIVGIVPFTFMKGYEATPDQAWNDTVNMTTAQINQLIAGPLSANFLTGVAADSNDSVAICGRNLGSGTRANALLNYQFGINSPVDQYAWTTDGNLSDLYPSATPGTLTFQGSYAAGQQITEVFNDGYDSGSGVQKTLNVDGTGSGIVLVAYVGLSDAANAHSGSSGGAATYLPFNGVYASDSGVINGSYSYWGQEHLLGSIGQGTTGTSTQSKTGQAIAGGIQLQLISSGAGTKTGAVGPSYTAQSNLIPKGLMQVTRGTDAGFPEQGTFH